MCWEGNSHGLFHLVIQKRPYKQGAICFQEVTLLTYNIEVPGSNIDQDTDYPD
jgi:hypothetical protein